MKQQQLLRHLLPLPQEIAIDNQFELHPSEIGLHLTSNAGPIAEQAATELRQLFIDKANCAPEGDRFAITLGIPDDQGQLADNPVDIHRLQNLPVAQNTPLSRHHEQAYLIRPVGQEQLLIAALNGRGLYYGARTLQQLLAATLTPERVIVPLAHITDWPDFDERGLWNFPDEAEWSPSSPR